MPCKIGRSRLGTADAGNVQEGRGHLPDAEAAARRALDIRPTYGYAHYNLAYILLEGGERDRALLEIQQELIEDGKQEGLSIIFYALGRKAESDRALASVIKFQADTNALGIVRIYAYRGQLADAMQWLERAYAQKDPYLCTLKSEQSFKNLEPDPRYKAFLRKMNLPE
jgi:tetratricopeptide (TPR) repeat protein